MQDYFDMEQTLRVNWNYVERMSRKKQTGMKKKNSVSNRLLYRLAPFAGNTLYLCGPIQLPLFKLTRFVCLFWPRFCWFDRPDAVVNLCSQNTWKASFLNACNCFQWRFILWARPSKEFIALPFVLQEKCCGLRLLPHSWFGTLGQHLWDYHRHIWTPNEFTA